MGCINLIFLQCLFLISRNDPIQKRKRIMCYLRYTSRYWQSFTSVSFVWFFFTVYFQYLEMIRFKKRNRIMRYSQYVLTKFHIGCIYLIFSSVNFQYLEMIQSKRVENNMTKFYIRCIFFYFSPLCIFNIQKWSDLKEEENNVLFAAGIDRKPAEQCSHFSVTVSLQQL